MVKIFYLPRRSILLTSMTLALTMLVLFCLAIIDNLIFVSTQGKQPYYQGCTNSKAVSLTFNVDWGEEYLQPLFQTLEENKIKATFFVTGRWVQANPELACQIAKNGHELGNHGLNHKHLKNLSVEQIQQEISGGAKIIFDVTGVKTSLFAPAYGEWDQKIAQAAELQGNEVIMWSIDTIDWQKPDVATIVKRVVPRIHNDAIILMHPTEPTVAALPEIIKALKSEGYRFLPVSQLIKSAEVKGSGKGAKSK